MAERLMNMVRRFGSMFEVWPTPLDLEEVSPHDATEMVRQSWQDAGDALWQAIGAIGIETDEAETKSTAGEQDSQGGPPPWPEC